MKLFLISLLAFIFMVIFIPIEIHSGEGLPTTIGKYQKLEQHYNWYSKYREIIVRESLKRGVDPALTCAVIQAESGGQNVVSRRANWNGTRDWGLMQVNSVHCPTNPRKLLNVGYNIQKGTWYLSRCVKKASGNIKRIPMYYNGGLGAKCYKYKNWKYVYRVLKYYQRSRV